MRLSIYLTTLVLGVLLAGIAHAQIMLDSSVSDTSTGPALHAPSLKPAASALLQPPNLADKVLASTTPQALPKLKASKTATSQVSSNPLGGSNGNQMEVTADQSLEYYQEAHVYVARGHARAIRGDMVVDADLLTAHERDKPKPAPGQPKPPKDPKAKDDNGAGDIDTMMAEGNVRITDSKSRTTGDKAVYDLNKHTMVVTGNNLRYENEKQTVTAKDALEYYEDKKIAVARGHAVEDDSGRHVEGDVLTATFADSTDGSQTDLKEITADGHVKVVTKTDTVFGDSAVYDAGRDLAIIKKNVRITRPDGMQLTGDIAEVDFKTNQSRLLNSGTGRVRALLPSHTTDKATEGDKTAAKDSTP